MTELGGSPTLFWYPICQRYSVITLQVIYRFYKKRIMNKLKNLWNATELGKKWLIFGWLHFWMTLETASGPPVKYVCPQTANLTTLLTPILKSTLWSYPPLPLYKIFLGILFFMVGTNHESIYVIRITWWLIVRKRNILVWPKRSFQYVTINLILVSCVAGVDAFCWDDKLMQNFWKPWWIL